MLPPLITLPIMLITPKEAVQQLMLLAFYPSIKEYQFMISGNLTLTTSAITPFAMPII